MAVRAKDIMPNLEAKIQQFIDSLFDYWLKAAKRTKLLKEEFYAKMVIFGFASSVRSISQITEAVYSYRAKKD